ncbi:hypothetical protein [Methanobrevibacter woesei]|uniref:hypothetical protein n=1 Tax=Methanobrevibacter woesei TaxID=190976 RepID=UPI0023F483C2|nr:hypothetical protein [Methanobrevibacter woesei]
MEEDIKTQLKKAKAIYQKKKHDEAEKIYKTAYDEDPEAFTIWDKRFYAWALYHLHIKNPSSEDELVKSCELISELLIQEDTNKVKVCAYTTSMLKIINYFKDNAYECLKWLDMLNPKLLNSNPRSMNRDGRISKFYSDKEKWYSLKTKHLLDMGEYEETIKFADEALNELDEFVNNSDIWFKWRIAIANKDLDNYDEALKYLEEIINSKNDWFILKELAEIYSLNGDYDLALKYAIDAALAKGDIKYKINLYRLLDEIFIAKDMDEDSESIVELIEAIEDDENFVEIEKELKERWVEIKFNNQQRSYGTISNILSHGKAGFIKADDGESYYFNIYEIQGDKSKVKEGDYVSFFLEESFDKKKNKKTLNAVNINIVDF